MLVEEENKPAWRIDVYADSGVESFAFQQVVLWRDFIVIGFGNHVYLVTAGSETWQAHDLGDYFSQLHPGDDYLLVASAERLMRIAPDGMVTWRTDMLAIDGIVLDDINGGVIYGQGEWDPPGGWRPFRVSLATGESLSSPGGIE